jgi:cobalt-zinc-cadmium efflux system protein
LNTAFAAGALINLGFVVVEVILGIAANSVALVADAAHNLGDVVALLLAWGAAWLSRRPPSTRRTYGWGRSSILASLINAVVLLIGVGGIGVEALQRLVHPEPVATGIVMAVAAAGIVVNGGSALLFRTHRHDDLNIRAQFQHLAGDALVSVAVVLAGLLIRVTGLTWLDAIASLLVGGIIVGGTWQTLKEAFNLSLDAVPAGVSQQEVHGWLAALPGVREVHDLHIWGLSTTETALTAHLVCEPTHGITLDEVATALHRQFHIGHATLQLETETEALTCRLRPADMV